MISRAGSGAMQLGRCDVFDCRLACGGGRLENVVVFSQPRLLLVLRLGTASVWIIFGLVFKLLNLLPRHESIVAAVLGPTWAGPVTLAVGLVEVLIGLWILSGRWPLLCAAIQTVAIIGMNLAEILWAREHLLSPVGMVCANSVFLFLGWFLAVHTAKLRTGA